MSDENTNGQTTGAENGSNGESNNAGTDNQGGNQGNTQQFVTVEQLNRALTGYNKRNEAATAKALETALNPLKELLAGMNKTGEGDETQTGTKNGSDQNGQTQQQQAQNNKELLKMQKQLEELTNRLKASDQEKAEAVKQALEEKVKAKVLSTLTELKVEKSDQVFRLIRDSLIVDDNGNVKMKVIDPQLGFEDEQDIKSGLTSWLNTEGSHFLPPRNVGGSGAQNGNRQGGGGNNNQNYSLDQLNKMKPSELANVDLSKVLGVDVLKTFLNVN